MSGIQFFSGQEPRTDGPQDNLLCISISKSTRFRIYTPLRGEDPKYLQKNSEQRKLDFYVTLNFRLRIVIMTFYQQFPLQKNEKFPQQPLRKSVKQCLRKRSIRPEKSL